jgi:hypothetical protein
MNKNVTIPFLTNDSDPDGDVISLQNYTVPSHGTVTVVNGTIVYTPNEDFFGSDSFNYTICDSDGDCDTAVVVITINPPPTAVNDTRTTDYDTPITIDIVDNDSHPQSKALNLTEITAEPSNGTVTIVNETTVIYTPDGGFVGTGECCVLVLNVSWSF